MGLGGLLVLVVHVSFDVGFTRLGLDWTWLGWLAGRGWAASAHMLVGLVVLVLLCVRVCCFVCLLSCLNCVVFVLFVV